MKPTTLRILACLGALVLFVVGYFVWAEIFLLAPGESLSSLVGTERAKPSTPPTGEPAPAAKPAGVVVRPPGSASSDYEKALNEYRSKGAYFQFVNCAGNPGTLTLKRGTVFMLDNRDNEAHKLKVGSVTYNLAAYGYKLVNPQKLGVNQITCDGGGAAAVNVQR